MFKLKIIHNNKMKLMIKNYFLEKFNNNYQRLPYIKKSREKIAIKLSKE